MDRDGDFRQYVVARQYLHRRQYLASGQRALLSTSGDARPSVCLSVCRRQPDWKQGWKPARKEFAPWPPEVSTLADTHGSTLGK